MTRLKITDEYSNARLEKLRKNGKLGKASVIKMHFKKLKKSINKPENAFQSQTASQAVFYSTRLI